MTIVNVLLETCEAHRAIVRGSGTYDFQQLVHSCWVFREVVFVSSQALRKVRSTAPILFRIPCRPDVDVFDSDFRQFRTKGVLAEAPLVAPWRLPHISHDADARCLQLLDVRIDIHSLIAEGIKVQTK
jgi:hypothetical protein